MDVEELGRAPVETDALALIDFALAVVGGDALLLAGLCEAGQRSRASLGAKVSREGGKPWLEAWVWNGARGICWACVRACVRACGLVWLLALLVCLPVHHVGHELHLGLYGGDLLRRGGLWAAESEERHVGRLVRGVDGDLWVCKSGFYGLSKVGRLLWLYGKYCNNSLGGQ